MSQFGYTVDGRNPAQPPDMYETLQRIGYLPYQLVSRISSINSMTIPNSLLNQMFVRKHARSLMVFFARISYEFDII